MMKGNRSKASTIIGMILVISLVVSIGFTLVRLIQAPVEIA